MRNEPPPSLIRQPHWLSGIVKLATILAVVIVSSALSMAEKGLELEKEYTAAELKVLRESALNGDKNAAFALGLYCAGSRDTLEESDSWFRVATMLGHTIAEFNLAVGLLLKNKHSPEGLFLIKRCIKRGDEQAKQFYDRLDKS